ncbi:hypothetical protein JOF55_000528 [Haloactinomyces albus]|uniref:Uncharacterized protein n=1 Tax=Haloactinomyces albus TaxID=1352928 RepID=A0AAE3Z8K4_9ACTN|nr:hypothetical protein [Haloactinomyces albus]
MNPDAAFEGRERLVAAELLPVVSRQLPTDSSDGPW